MTRLIRPKRKLPTKWSRLLRIAVRDARKIEKNPRYRLNMGSWHAAVGPVCHVCLAGSIISQTLKVSPRRSVSLFNFDVHTRDALGIVNDLREGDLPSSKPITDSNVAGVSATMRFIQRHITMRPDGRRAPWHIYLKAADRLERLGL